MDVKLVLLMLLGVFTLTKCQQNVRVPENAQRRVAPSLEVCYRNRQLFERDNRLPMTMNTLIELIRRLESVHGLNMDIRQLTIAIIQRFKQDGNYERETMKFLGNKNISNFRNSPCQSC